MKGPLRSTPAPVVKVRIILILLSVIAVIIAGPLLAVWKQVYINDLSIRLESMNDTIVSLNREIASLRITRERLSDPDRIESFARTALGLEYPSSSRIEIVRIDGKKTEDFFEKVYAAIRKSVLRDKG